MVSWATGSINRSCNPIKDLRRIKDLDIPVHWHWNLAFRIDAQYFRGFGSEQTQRPRVKRHRLYET
jgi:hypothetical protein